MGTTLSDKRNAVSAARRALEQAERELALSRPSEPSGVGSMVLITGSFRAGQKAYSYAAVKGGDLWYLTGQQTPNDGLEWDEVVDYFENKLRGGVKFNLMVASKEI